MSFKELHSNVIDPDLCTRCGLCVGICPVNAIELGMYNYPYLLGDCIDCSLCTKSCPGAEVDFPNLSKQVFSDGYDPTDLRGHVDKVYVAHAADDSVRNTGTSGGLVTALLLHLLEKGTICGAIVASSSADAPCQIKGVLASTRDEIIDAAKSKYFLTSSMEALQGVRRKKGKFAIVGLPCQVQGVRKLMSHDPSLAKKIYCVIGLYCHCNMEPMTPHDILKSKKIDPASISRFNFRGGPWPGGFHIVNRDGSETPLHTTLYTTILNVLFKIYGAPRCYLCVDTLSEYADISCGDFWANDYKNDFNKLERCTLVSQRTAKGTKILQSALQDNAITMHQLPATRYSKRITKMVQGKKSRNLARISRMRKNGLPVPDYHFSPPAPSKKAKRKEMILRLSFLFRRPYSRRIILKLLFSKAAKGFELINLYRKKIFCNYHAN